MVDQKRSAAARIRSRARLVAQGVFSLMLVAAIFAYLFRGIDLTQVWAEITAMTPLELAGLLAIVAWNLATYALVPVTAGLSFWRIMMVTQAATAVANTVPTVGPAIGTGLTYRMLGSWGYSRSRATTALLVSGVWNSLVKLSLPVLALALLALQGNASPKRISAALVGIAGLAAAIVVFVLLLRSQQLARWFGLVGGRVASRLLGLVGRPPVAGWELATTKFRTRTLALLQGRWVPITAATLVSHLSLYLVLLVSLRQIGISDAEVAWVQVLAVFTFARLATAVPFTRPGPGGRGGTDRRAGRRRRRSGAGHRRGPGVPGADLGAAHPARGGLLAVVAPEPAPVPAAHRRQPAGSHPQGRHDAGHQRTQQPDARQSAAPRAGARPRSRDGSRAHVFSRREPIASALTVGRD